MVYRLSTFRFGENWVICLGNVDGERKGNTTGTGTDSQLILQVVKRIGVLLIGKL